ncbi:specifically androgen-regulated gene protein [Hyla sarda]|uniref:specifically androgen-regulated gene protein n=1 Tax=Hyla sarda TaxID=327740 RepID=UPI0024C22FB6|nr:specifically androgen-regulated gene protein [Hyla sarda]XP_056416668.1 specifically androgen-regulated gene protein [Hyla sarda]XP_056416669.1 specifically androgen-regulated gene protein [Hyla sarda]XP_056416670.1 specifically androgen-regulated gene protein [Hyla sarda]XP_056416671.1 specifically androgen-regulated gene protein [Hyla sarda]XP_056416672.1 specifically androgen-regulated gene protein [Hyla sarda]XP_056416673.1 specifically androgen-regulated gene protein [Hyla sarda]XP_0
MPEKTLWTRHVGMEALNSVGSTGSCDSMESISSNHSAFSGDGYDHLSAEERECLMFLEETIDSLDNEDDSGVSNDELEVTEKSNIHSAPEPTKAVASDGNDKTKPILKTFPKLEEWAYVARIPQGYHSFPRIIQASREEITKHTTDVKLPDSTSDQKSWHGKPKSLSSINKPQTGEPRITDLLIIPPPEPFRDPQVIDKRRSVTDPTDAREVRYDRALFKPATISEYKETQSVVRPFSAPAPLLFPRVSSPKTDTGSQETVSQAEEKILEAKQGPPTAPKPRTLPPHIVIKSSSGMVSSLDPQKRPRTFSAHERTMDKTSEHTIPKVPHSKEQERARLEALHKLGLDVKLGSQENLSMRSSKTDLSLTQGVADQGYKDRKSDGHQDKVDSVGELPAPPSIIIHKTEEVRKETFSKNRLSIKSNSLEKDEPVTVTAPLSQKYPNIVEVPPQHHIKSSIFGKRPSIKVNTQEKAEDVVIPSSKPLNEVHTITDGSSKNIEADSTKHTSPSHSRPQTKDTKSDKSGSPAREVHTGSEVALKSPKHDVDRKPSALKTNPVEKGRVPEINPVSLKPTSEKPQEILGSSENISLISTSPGKTFSFPRPKEVVVPHHSPEVVKVQGNDKVLDKSNRHSTHFEASNEPYLRFPQGSVPGLRQINIKSNTLERSGVGLSGSMPSLEKESQKSSSSFFKKPLFSGGFLRNSRPRPASLGTGKDFANLEPSTSDAETTEKRSFFSRPARSSAPVTSVKITPKGTSEEHRKEALKKLGILKE